MKQADIYGYTPSNKTCLEDGIAATVENALDRTVFIGKDVEELGNGRPKTGTVHEERDDNEQDIEDGQAGLLPVDKEAAPVDVEPEYGTKAKGEPRNGSGRGDGEDGVEDGDGVGKEEAEDPVEGHDGHPDSPGAGRVGSHLVGVLALLHHHDVDVLDTGVAEGETGRENGGEDDSVGDLGNVLRGGSQSGRDGVFTSKAVDNDGNDGVEADGTNLETSQSEAKVLYGVDHLSHVRDKVDVTGVGVADLEASVQTLTERRVSDNDNVALPTRWRGGGVFNAESDDNDKGSGDDGDAAGDS